MKKIFILLPLLLISCKDLQRKDILGTWKSDDGFCILKINNDSTFEIKNVPKSILFSENKMKGIFSGSGKWDLTCSQNNWSVDLIFPIDTMFPNINDTKYSCSYQLSIERDVFNSSNWIVYFYNGAEDEKYYFYRVSNK